MNRLIKYNLLGLLIVLLSVNVNSQETGDISDFNTEDYIHMTDDGGVRINIGKYCYDTYRVQNNPRKQCEFIHKGIKLNLTCDAAFHKTPGYTTCRNGMSGNTTIFSNQKIKEIVSGFKMAVDRVGLLERARNSGHLVTKIDDQNSPWYSAKLYSPYGDGSTVASIVVKLTASEGLFDYFVMSKLALNEAYNNVLDQTLVFQAEIARSHQGHLDRYIQSLRDGISVLDDKKQYSLLDWRVRESSRRIVAFGIVISEILEDYAHVVRLQHDIRSIGMLTGQLKKSYGWNRGLAGNVSKASGALLELLELELSEIGKIKLSVGFSNMGIYSNLIKEVKRLTAKVNSSRSGDMAAQREIFSLLDAWNSDVWQDELTSLIEAPIDFKKLVSKKLFIMLMAVEGIADMTKLDFVIPTYEE